MNYYFGVSNLELFCSNQKKYIVSDSVQFHKAHFIFDSQWNGYTKTIIFKNSKTKEVVNQTLLDPQNPVCDIPWEVIDSEGYLIVCAYGILGTSEIYTVMPNPLPIVMSDKASGVNPADPTPSVYEQIIDMLSQIGGIYTLPTATNTILGGIKIGNHLSIDSNGIMTVDHVSQMIDGIMSSADKIKLDNIEADANKYVLPTASDTILGGIKIGTNLSIDINGVASSQDTTYSVATQTTDGLMSSTDKTKLDGVEDGANNYSLPTATISTLGGIKIDDSTIKINSGVISSPTEIDDTTSSLTKTYSSSKEDATYERKARLIKLFGTKSGTTTINLTDATPSVLATNYIETVNTNNTTIDWVNGLNMTFTRIASAPVKLKKGDTTTFNIYTAFNRDCSVEFGAISYINGVPISTPQAFGNQDFSGVSGFTTVQVLKYEMEFDLLGDESIEYPAGTVFTTKLFKRQESVTPTLTTRYLYGVNANGLDRFSYAKIKTNI